MNRSYLLSILGVIALCVMGAGYVMKDTAKSSTCSKETCADLTGKNTCLCYCSRVCVPREKDSLEDVPVYVDEAEAKKLNVRPGCYCKQWDLDNYNTPSKGGMTCHQKDEMRKNNIKIPDSEPKSCKIAQ